MKKATKRHLWKAISISAFYCLPGGTKETNKSNGLSASCNKRWCSVPVFFFVVWIKFGETKQKVVALVATTLKALLSVAKTDGGLSGRDLYAGNIYDLSWNIIVHIYLLSAYKKVRPKRNAPKKCIPSQLLSHELLPNEGMRKKEKTLFTKSIFPSLVRTYAIRVTSIFYHTSSDLSTKLENLSEYCCFDEILRGYWTSGVKYGILWVAFMKDRRDLLWIRSTICISRLWLAHTAGASFAPL
jgi:hypothetical protein